MTCLTDLNTIHLIFILLFLFIEDSFAFGDPVRDVVLWSPPLNANVCVLVRCEFRTRWMHLDPPGNALPKLPAHPPPRGQTRNYARPCLACGGGAHPQVHMLATVAVAVKK